VSSISDLTNLVAAIASVLTAVFAIAISVGLRRRERRQAIASVHFDLTTGETALARDVVGSALYAPEGLARVGNEAAISSYFKLYWAVQRTENTYRVFNLRRDRLGRLDSDEEAFLSWNFHEIVQNIVEFRRRFRDELAIQDEDAWESFVTRLKDRHPRLASEVLGGQSLTGSPGE
jgi:hypothetical protein